jgi:hypothetical protein
VDRIEVDPMIDLALHALGGAALASALWYGGGWSIAPVVLFVGLLREQAQHRDDGIIGWISWHRLAEAGAWALGALIAVSVAALLDRS